MIVCTECKTMMINIKSGVKLRWNITHAYAGDLYECNKCKKKMICSTDNPQYCDSIKDDDVFMDSNHTTETAKEELRKINIHEE